MSDTHDPVLQAKNTEVIESQAYKGLYTLFFIIIF